MAETLTDSLTGTLQVRLSWDRTDTQEVGTVTNRSTKVTTYDVADGDGPGEADLVFTDTRSIPANTVEVIDLLTLTQQAFDVDVPFTFRQVRTVRVVNNETAAGRSPVRGRPWTAADHLRSRDRSGQRVCQHQSRRRVGRERRQQSHSDRQSQRRGRQLLDLSAGHQRPGTRRQWQWRVA